MEPQKVAAGKNIYYQLMQVDIYKQLLELNIVPAEIKEGLRQAELYNGTNGLQIAGQQTLLGDMPEAPDTNGIDWSKVKPGEAYLVPVSLMEAMGHIGHDNMGDKDYNKLNSILMCFIMYNQVIRKDYNSMENAVFAKLQFSPMISRSIKIQETDFTGYNIKIIPPPVPAYMVSGPLGEDGKAQYSSFQPRPLFEVELDDFRYQVIRAIENLVKERKRNYFSFSDQEISILLPRGLEKVVSADFEFEPFNIMLVAGEGFAGYRKYELRDIPLEGLIAVYKGIKKIL